MNRKEAKEKLKLDYKSNDVDFQQSMTIDDPKIKKYLITNQPNYDNLFDLNMLQRHNQLNDCYVALDDKVYNITKYKQYLKKKNKNRRLNLVCGNAYIKPAPVIFETDRSSDFEIGIYTDFKRKMIIYTVIGIISFYSSLILNKNYHNSYTKIFLFVNIVVIIFVSLFIYRYFDYNINLRSSIQIE